MFAGRYYFAAATASLGVLAGILILIGMRKSGDKKELQTALVLTIISAVASLVALAFGHN